jgi:hypothetical protein
MKWRKCWDNYGNDRLRDGGNVGITLEMIGSGTEEMLG